ncbi:CRP/FNR family transcriptional regulator, anaerobic regulatory protein [Roseovarius marisflavi]|uniref:CRP/FNR family transcriptional regulator, anaerobic regulatory protein n=1 Tax=Roseovarius marisflavi TaxID=1054996 RepID=A0A1M7AE55_9RHOB|nr:helix-turn-helix domain-containing protein [Roseovarius marisflavi]SHL40982.1 CRP/FNR family transcriptional regulator, anaerobic regulatory protein [Roseovarius marisflavi]
MYVTIPSEQTPFAPQLRCARKQATTVTKVFKAGNNLYFEGDKVDRLYQVQSGVLRLTRLLEDGRRQVIAFGFPGDIVGFPCDGRYHTDCDVLTEARLQAYHLSALEGENGNPELHKELLQAALREISAMQDHFMMLGRKSAVEKVASFLCVLTERMSSDTGSRNQAFLPMSRSDIADFLGLTTETVSRTLSQLRKSGIIAINNIHTVVILQPNALFGLSQGREDIDCPSKSGLHGLARAC